MREAVSVAAMQYIYTQAYLEWLLLNKYCLIKIDGKNNQFFIIIFWKPIQVPSFPNNTDCHRIRLQNWPMEIRQFILQKYKNKRHVFYLDIFRIYIV